jgi:tRNA (guanine-N7-)-methyltransferase
MNFYRDLRHDPHTPPLWHYMPRLGADEKPIRTEDGAPDVRPFAWSEIFGDADAPLEIEIGSGKGGFLVESAEMRPGVRLLGAEWDASIARYAADRAHRRHLGDRAAVLRGDVFYFLRDLVPAGSVHAFHMYFPDPWPKARQQKNRLLLREGFLEIVHKALGGGGRPFYWGTDHAEYNELALAAFDGFRQCKVLERNTAQPTLGIQTNFEKKYRKEGRPIYRSVVEFS